LATSAGQQEKQRDHSSSNSSNKKERHGPPMRAAVIFFDVKNVDLAALKELDLDEGDEWTTFTGQCLTKDGHLKAYRGERNALELVMGKLVHNPDQVVNH
jgi:hypothetical protein